jgi:MarR family transcriptional regulator for hemolysin
MTDSKHPVRRLVVLAAGIYLKTRRWTERRLRAHGMTYPQYGALGVLFVQPGLTQRELAGALESDTTTAMVLCDSLGRKGWLERSPDPLDRRANRLHLTAAGKEAYGNAQPDVETGFAAVADAIGGQEAERALVILEKLHSRISEITAEGVK